MERRRAVRRNDPSHDEVGKFEVPNANCEFLNSLLLQSNKFCLDFDLKCHNKVTLINIHYLRYLHLVIIDQIGNFYGIVLPAR